MVSTTINIPRHVLLGEWTIASQWEESYPRVELEGFCNVGGIRSVSHRIRLFHHLAPSDQAVKKLTIVEQPQAHVPIEIDAKPYIWGMEWRQQGMMQSILFSVFCGLSFVTTSFGALAFGERFGLIPPVREELTASTYSLQKEKFHVELTLDPFRIRVYGDNFIAVTFGSHKGMLFPNGEGFIQAGDSILIVLFGDHADRGKIFEYISNAPNQGHGAILNDPYLGKAEIVMFGFKIGHDTSSQDSASPVRKRHGDDLAWPAKRQAVAEPEPVLSWYRNHNPLNNVDLNIGETMVKMRTNLVAPALSAEIEAQMVKLRVSGGAVALVSRNGKVEKRDLVSSRLHYDSYNIIPLCELPAENALEVRPGDLVFMFIPLTNNNNLETLKFVPGLVKDIEANWNLFVRRYCKDQVAVTVFIVGNKQ
ncbi:hypothetical protein PSACC_01550 [Paramicrosporidium saccamoebae]|uniref:Uncharacterized protein n=1 Tax=Paramicrosporidium saccamoebae TaxID=1246581 RepID=A0A2H9TLK0_9FUNG|nr:hypothetical protein PSACC_01550 [Paramicrosporidium saccamoebae]